MVVKIRGRVCYLVKRMFVSGAFKRTNLVLHHSVRDELFPFYCVM